MSGPTKRAPRKKKVPPGTMKTWNLETMSEDDVADLVASGHFVNDIDRTLTALRKLRAQWEADGADPFEMLAIIVAHNHAVADATRRGKQRGPNLLKARAHARHTEIAQQLLEAKENIKAVAIDRQASAKPASSERTLRRVKKQLKATKT